MKSTNKSLRQVEAGRTNYSYIIGIDPGVTNGGIAIWSERTKRRTVYKIPRNAIELVQIVKSACPVGGRILISVEQLNLRPDDLANGRGQENGKDSNVNPGKAYNIIKMLKHQSWIIGVCETIANVDVIEMAPVTWQSTLGLKGRGINKDARKEWYKITAQERYLPSNQKKVTNWSADAILIAEATKSKLRNDLKYILDKLEL